MALSLDEVRWVAYLARLAMSDAELAMMQRDLSAIVDYVNQLAEVATDEVEPLAHAIDLENVFRADEPSASLDPDEALANAPQRRGNFFSVPAVLE